MVESRCGILCSQCEYPGNWNGYDDPNFYVMCLTTERYIIFIVDGEDVLDATGTL